MLATVRSGTPAVELWSFARIERALKQVIHGIERTAVTS